MDNTMQITKIPDTLHQYRPPEGWAFENLCNRVLYLNSPRNFNDPYDFRYPPRLHSMTDAEFSFLHSEMVDKNHLLEHVSNETKEHFRLRVNGKFEEVHTEIYGSAGFSCFSESNRNLLMWSHYGGRGKGFCLALDIRAGKGLSLHPHPNHEDHIAKIQYREPFTMASDIVSFMKERSGGARMPLLSFLMHKAKEWEYEQEWRLLMPREGEIGYAEKALKAVYFGTEATKGTEELVRAIIKEQYVDKNPHIKLHKARLSKSKYQVEFDEIPL